MDEQPSTAELQSLAIAAAHQASEGASAMIKFGREGEEIHATFDNDAIEKLADATKIALEIDLALGRSDEERGRLHVALTDYLEGWVG